MHVKKVRRFANVDVGGARSVLNALDEFFARRAGNYMTDQHADVREKTPRARPNGLGRR